MALANDIKSSGKKCQIIGCKKRRQVREWCRTHYYQLRSFGVIQNTKSYYTIIRHGIDHAFFIDLIKLSEEYNGFTKYDFHERFFSKLKLKSAERRWLRMIRFLDKHHIPYEKSYEVAGPTSQKCTIIKILVDELPFSIHVD